MSKSILITGASGFLGKHLVNLLDKDYELLLPSSSVMDVTNYEDVCDILTRYRPEFVIHLAAQCGGIGANQVNPAYYFHSNNLMGLNIMNACHELGISKLITLGSVCSYPKFTPVPFKEEDLWNGYPEETNAPYGIAKRNLITGCKAYSDQYGCNFIHLIPVNMYGEYDNFDLESSHVIPALIRKMHTAKAQGLDEVVIWGDGSASREFLYAGDCARAIKLALEGYNSPDPINIGTGMEITIRDLVEKVKSIVGFSGQIVFDTSKPNGQPRRCLDTSKAKEKFGFEAQICFEEGLQKTYNWYLENISQDE